MNSNINTKMFSNILLEYLRKYYNDHRIDYIAVPEEILGGYESTVYKFKLKTGFNKLNNFLIIRVSHESYDTDQFIYDSNIQNALSETTIPVAKIHIICKDKSIFGGAFIIMDYMPGKVMWDVSSKDIPRFFAESHIAIHNTETGQLIKTLNEKGYQQRYMFNPINAALDNFDQTDIFIDDIKKWLIDNRPKSERLVICHGDFHPNNILVHDDQVSGIVDWHFSIGEPEHDVALTVNILTINSKLCVPESEFQKLDDFTLEYLAAYQSRNDLDKSKLDYYNVVHCIRDLGEGIKRGGKLRTHPYRVNKKLEIIENITGLKINLLP